MGKCISKNMTDSVKVILLFSHAQIRKCLLQFRFQTLRVKAETGRTIFTAEIA